MPSTTATEPLGRVDPEQTARLDGFVERATAAAARSAPSTTRLASTGSSTRSSSPASSTRSSSRAWRWRTPGFGVFEDKVVKNYIATEFLHDYLKDKRSVGVIEEDPARAIHYVAEPIGVVLALTADHQPDLDRAVQGDRRRQDAQRDDLPPVGARGALRPATRRAAPGGRRGRRHAARHAPGRPRPDARRLAVPVPPPRRRLHLDHRRPEGGRRRQRRGQALPQRRGGQRAGLRPPQRRRRDGGGRHADLQDLRLVRDLPGRADLHRRRRGLRRDAGRAPAPRRAAALRGRGRRAQRRRASTTDGPSSSQRSASRASNLARARRLRGRDRRQGAARPAADATWTSWSPTRSLQRS